MMKKADAQSMQSQKVRGGKGSSIAPGRLGQSGANKDLQHAHTA